MITSSLGVEIARIPSLHPYTLGESGIAEIWEMSPDKLVDFSLLLNYSEIHPLTSTERIALLTEFHARTELLSRTVELPLSQFNRNVLQPTHPCNPIKHESEHLATLSTLRPDVEPQLGLHVIYTSRDRELYVTAYTNDREFCELTPYENILVSAGPEVLSFWDQLVCERNIMGSWDTFAPKQQETIKSALQQKRVITNDGDTADIEYTEEVRQLLNLSK